MAICCIVSPCTITARSNPPDISIDAVHLFKLHNFLRNLIEPAVALRCNAQLDQGKCLVGICAFPVNQRLIAADDSRLLIGVDPMTDFRLRALPIVAVAGAESGVWLYLQHVQGPTPPVIYWEGLRNKTFLCFKSWILNYSIQQLPTNENIQSKNKP